MRGTLPPRCPDASHVSYHPCQVTPLQAQGTGGAASDWSNAEGHMRASVHRNRKDLISDLDLRSEKGRRERRRDLLEIKKESGGGERRKEKRKKKDREKT